MISCNICPHECLLAENEIGKCKVRKNTGSAIEVDSDYYGYCSILSVDPIEKRPFFHYCPGTRFLSVGLNFCSLCCSYCFNFEVSQQPPKEKNEKHRYFPTDLKRLAIAKGVTGVAFTYNEPTIHFEYLRDFAQRTTATDLHLVIKTNGFVNEKTLRHLGCYYDAFNVDIKGDDEEYRRTCGAWLKPVKDSIEILNSMGVWVEVSYLVLPRLVEDLDYHEEMSDWLANTNSSIPIHILYAFPFHKMKERYDKEQLLPIYELFCSKMKHVYISNLYDSEFIQYRDTNCSKCGKTMISRNRGVKIIRLTCCGKRICGRFLEKKIGSRIFELETV